MIIDFHAHYLAREHLNMHTCTPEGHIIGAAIHGQGANAIMEANGIPLGSSCQPEAFHNLPARLELMAQSGVDLEVLSPPPFMCFQQIAGNEAARLTREQNEAIASVVRQNSDSFRGLGIVPLQDPEIAATEVVYLMDTLGLSGIEILTHVAGKDLDQLNLDPLWQALDERAAVVLLHPDNGLNTPRLLRYYLWNLLGNPVETALALACLAFSGVFEHFPHIRFIAAHGGGVAPFVLGRWEHGAAVRPELAHLKISPASILNHIYVDSIVHSPQVLYALIEMLGAERIVLGSDMPFDMGTEKPVALSGASLPENIRQRILARHQDLI
jgi:aminocarboxymuconate-semialdehyde decarboxylase